MRSMMRLASLFVLLMAATTVFAQDQRPERPPMDPAMMIQGEYTGEVPLPAQAGTAPTKMGVQIVALGNDEYNVVMFKNGLPGEDGVTWPPLSQETVSVKMADGKVTMTGKDWNVEMAVPKPGERPQRDEAKPQRGGFPQITVPVKVGDQVYPFTKVMRRSETLGQKAPEGAIVMFEGNMRGFGMGERRGKQQDQSEVNLSTENLEQGQVDEATGLLKAEGGVLTKERFQDFQLHLEFRLPFMPEARGQGRANSGLYLQGRYEVQILDSFGLETKDNECGGIYKVAVPKVNACFPPMTWQTYDVDFTAAKFNDAGEKTAPAKVVVKLNGIEIQNVEPAHETPGGVVTPTETPEAGPIFLQDHNNPVRFRNFWVLKK
ncbi:MAG: DUF1080 domain-containing protein [Thermoguttaceae bacterium]|nr:DUF1080 domain-containing protein [Thermoguttaceae bacterium]